MYKNFLQKKVLATEKPQLLCYATFFDSLRCFGVIAASQIVYVVCAENIVPSYGTDFYFLGYTKYRESIAFPQKIDFQILMNLHILRASESKKVIFGMSSVCVCVCVCGHHNSKNN